MWRLLLFSILIASTHSALYTPLCPDAGEPVCAKSGFEFIYFENECKLNVFSYKELFAGRPSPTKVSLVECFSNCAGIVCPAIFQPVCAQQVPGGTVQTASNACLVNQLICQTRQQWVIIANGTCPETSVPNHSYSASSSNDAAPPYSPAASYTPTLAAVPVPAPNYEAKATYEPTVAPATTYYPPQAPAAPSEPVPTTSYNALTRSDSVLSSSYSTPAPVEPTPTASYNAPAPQTCTADYSALAPEPVPADSYAAPAQDSYAAPSQTLPTVPSPYSPPAAPDSYIAAADQSPSPGANSYLATGVDPAPFAYPPSDYNAAPATLPLANTCQASYSQEPKSGYASLSAVDSYSAPSSAVSSLNYAAPAPASVPATYDSAPLPYTASDYASPLQSQAAYPAPAPAPAPSTYDPASLPYSTSEAIPAPAPSAYQDASQQSPSDYASPLQSQAAYPAPAPDPAPSTYDPASLPYSTSEAIPAPAPSAYQDASQQSPSDYESPAQSQSTYPALASAVASTSYGSPATYEPAPLPYSETVPALPPSIYQDAQFSTVYASPVPNPTAYPAPEPASASYDPAPLPYSTSEAIPASAPAAYQDTSQQSPSYASPAPSLTTYPAPTPACTNTSTSYGNRDQYSVETLSSYSPSSQYPTATANQATDSYSAPSQPAYSDANQNQAAAIPSPYSAPAPAPYSVSDQYTAPDPNSYASTNQNSKLGPDSYLYPSTALATDLSLHSAPTSASLSSSIPYTAEYPLPAPVALPDPAIDSANYTPTSAYSPTPSPPACTCASNSAQSVPWRSSQPKIASLKYDIPAIIGGQNDISEAYTPDIDALISKWIDSNPLISKNCLQSLAPFYYQPTYTLIEYRGSKDPRSY